MEISAVYIILGVDLEGHRDILGHWIGDGAEGANFWLSMLASLQTPAHAAVPVVTSNPTPTQTNQAQPLQATLGKGLDAAKIFPPLRPW